MEGLVHANFPDITGIEALAFASSAIFDSALGVALIKTTAFR